MCNSLINHSKYIVNKLTYTEDAHMDQSITHNLMIIKKTKQNQNFFRLA